jgi:hypothetical protein
VLYHSLASCSYVEANRLCRHLTVGDLFILGQIKKNINRDIFEKFMEALPMYCRQEEKGPEAKNAQVEEAAPEIFKKVLLETHF